MNEQAIEKRREYHREYRRKNRDRLNAYQSAWRRNNPDKVQTYLENHWTKKAEEETA